MFIMQASLFEISYKYVSFFGLWNLTIAPNFFGALFIMFSVLFISSYFELQNYVPKMEKIYTRVILAIYIPLLILILIPKTYSLVLPLLPLAGMIMIFFILALIFIGYQKSPFSCRYIFIGWLASGSLIIIYVLELIGLLHEKPIDDLFIRTGTLMEMIFFSFALGDKLKFLKIKTIESEMKVLESEKQMLIKAKLATAGETIGNIAHQWRQPLNRLSMVLLKIQSDLYLKQEIDKQNLLQDTQTGEIIIKDMSKTIDLFLNFFADNQDNESFDINESIADAVTIMQDSLYDNAIELYIESFSCSMKGSKSEFAQVILNLLSNAQNALIAKQPFNRWIKLNFYQGENEIEITILDNGGGIESKLISSIFDPYISSGNNKNGAGLGLYIVKNIITKRFNGEIHASNKDDGAEFKITLPILT